MRHELGGAQARPIAPGADWSTDFTRHQVSPAMGNSSAELERAFAHANVRPGPIPNPGAPMHMRPIAGPHAGWAEQFHQPASQAAASTAIAAAQPVASMQPNPMAMAFNEARMYSMMSGPGPMMHQPMMHRPMVQQQQQQVGGTAQQQPAISESSQADVLANNDDLAKTAAQILQSMRDSANPKFKSSEFFSFMQQLADKQATIEGDQVVTNDKQKQSEASGPTWATEFEKRADELISRESKSSEQTPADGKIVSEEFARGLERNWAEEFEQSLDGPLNESTVSGHPQELGADAALDQPSSEYIHREADNDWLERFKDNIEPMLTDQDREWLNTQKEWETLNSLEASYRANDPELNVYHFQRGNYYETMASEALRDIIQQMQQNPEAASLSDTIMAMESAVTQNPQDAAMWLQLGLKQQENEQEQAAIAALRKAISLNPESLDAHLALAVSYTNEGYQMDAYDELHEWIARHDRYKSLVPETAPESMSNSQTRKDYVQDLYIKAARMAPGQDWDPDVQIALGVLFNISSEYDKAVDCFKAALSKRPDDYILWNRLGATQAHIGSNREATAAYFRALELHPSFIRARYNLSLASTNMGQHREAAENCLIALSLQQREMQTIDKKGKAAQVDNAAMIPASGMSTTIWNALQLSMYMLGEPKLAEACEKQDLDAFREKFDF
ncbi:hypothetical protein IWW36_002467 [Coemansia brasiliensis]|uniref:Peroxisomal targeting signal receptor n=1 Tax=Coemansia brasiliensis TaxID=2650707 RepID=A0A9W8I705_9FUNG|nr:hypothetical protein IWW36_002467 [Coemansia brasiliensis]